MDSGLNVDLFSLKFLLCDISPSLSISVFNERVPHDLIGFPLWELQFFHSSIIMIVDLI